MHSCLYVGQVRHRRFAPRQHAFSYRLFQLYLDLDELDLVFKKHWLWSTKRPNLAWFRRSDHMGNPDIPLADEVRNMVQNQTGTRPEGPIRLLTHLRYLGIGFNPVSFYFCYDVSGKTVETVVAEVNNTPWGERHCYVLGQSQNDASGKKMLYEIDKQFHVSPFMDLDIQYRWRLTSPAKKIAVHIENIKQGEKIFDATLALERKRITSVSLSLMLIQFPIITAKVMLAIYFEALRLWLKKIPFIQHPGKTEAPTTVTSNEK